MHCPALRLLLIDTRLMCDHNENIDCLDWYSLLHGGQEQTRSELVE